VQQTPHSNLIMHVEDQQTNNSADLVLVCEYRSDLSEEKKNLFSDYDEETDL